MDAQIVIGPARAGEQQPLTRIAHAAKRHWGYPEEWIRSWSADLTVSADAIAHDPVYCARSGGDIAGFYALSVEGDVAELEHMWVEPGYMGLGVGRALFEHAKDTAARLGCGRMRIASDPNALGFYERMGARRVGAVASTPAPRILPLLELAL
ncbi:MAG TPA: GNAT family N-acetyltransferase [Candidatus Limnocylindrales bacterium]|nr:GNAT family N-acetyltransferase [Candidatus Limnocylindrales bacterium]